jgi:hypothetical protein
VYLSRGLLLAVGNFIDGYFFLFVFRMDMVF